MKVSVIGSGYVGLVTAACLAEVGHDLVCVDVDARKVERLKNGEIPIHEPGLDAIVHRNAAAGRLLFTTRFEDAVAVADLHMIAVGTPPDEDGSADLGHVLAAARSIAGLLERDAIVIVKSTVPVGTCDRVEAAIRETLAARGASLAVTVVSNPEFLKEGAAIDDFMSPDRIVVGTRDAAAIAVLRELYAPFQRNRERLVFMSRRSSELTKYAANAMLATRISFMNELSGLAETLEADIEDVRRGIGSDPRIGSAFLYPGAGYGGSCFPKDVSALLSLARQVGRPLELIGAVERVNERQKAALLEKIRRRLGTLRGRCFAVWGLAFKPNTDDMREAPARVLIEGLWAEGARVRAYDPAAMDSCRAIYGERPDLTLVPGAMAALEGADALVVVTEWKEFRAPDFKAIAGALREKVVFDGRNLYDPAVIARAGLDYYAFGRPGSTAA
ncbi:MAG: UDP-glucose/GDP-mannose dehydrogenase family protein [Lautropia sp.]